jgi:hypothetical protein
VKQNSYLALVPKVEISVLSLLSPLSFASIENASTETQASIFFFHRKEEVY